jgi:hypothetical protein
MMPNGFRGIICVGLFTTPIPQSKPIACTIASPDGDYEMQGVPQGKLFLFALGLELPIQRQDCFCYDSALRAGGHSIRVCGESIMGDTDLVLRQPLPTDAPILLFLTDLMQRVSSERESHDASASTSNFGGAFLGQDGTYAKRLESTLKQV